MEFGDENVPPVKDSLCTTSPACSELRLPSNRSVLGEVNMPLTELEKLCSLVSKLSNIWFLNCVLCLPALYLADWFLLKGMVTQLLVLKYSRFT